MVAWAAQWHLQRAGYNPSQPVVGELRACDLAWTAGDVVRDATDGASSRGDAERYLGKGWWWEVWKWLTDW